MCAVRTAGARVFDAKLVVELGGRRQQRGPLSHPALTYRADQFFSLAQLETKLRLICAVRTAVARAFDAKLVVELGGLGGGCCNKIRAWNSGTAAGMVVCPICRAVSHAPFLPHVPCPLNSQVPEQDTSSAAWGGRGEGDAARL